MDNDGTADIDLVRFGLAADSEAYKVVVWSVWPAIEEIEKFVQDFGIQVLELMYSVSLAPPGGEEEALIGALYTALKASASSLHLRQRCERWLQTCMRLPRVDHPRFGKTQGGNVLNSRDGGGFDTYYQGKPLHVLKLAVACFYTCAGDFFSELVEEAKRRKRLRETAEPATST